MIRVLVTGGAGYIGSVLVRKLLKQGYRVRVYDQLIFGDFSLREIKNQIELVKGDIRKISLQSLSGVDAIIHLAGFSTEPTSQYDPRLTDAINHRATEKLAKLAKKLGIKRFVFPSSCSVYFSFNTPPEPPLYKELDMVNPISVYSITKRCAEQALLALADGRFQPTIFRLGTVYGYSPRMRYDLVFNSFVRDAYLKQLLTIDASGKIWRPMIDIQDVTEICSKTLQMPLSDVGGKIFNLVDTNWKIGDLAEKIKHIIYRRMEKKITLKIEPSGVLRNYKADNTLLKNTYNFKPTRTIDDALIEDWNRLKNNTGHTLNNTIFYNDILYKHYLNSTEGRRFRQHA